MGRLLPLTSGHVFIPNQEEQQALKDMIVKSGFTLKDVRVIPIIREGEGNEDSGPEGGELL